MLELDAGGGSLGGEADFDLRRLRPAALPRKDNPPRWFADNHAADNELFAVGVALVKSAAGERLEADLLQPSTSEGIPSI
jgi:hypothetical protein